MRTADPCPLHYSPGLPTAKVCGFGHIRLGEFTTFSRYFLLIIRRTITLFWERRKFSIGTNKTTEYITRVLLQGQQPLLQAAHSFVSVPQSVPSFSQCHNQHNRYHSHDASIHTAPLGLTGLLAEQSGASTPALVVPNSSYSDRPRCPNPRSRPLVYPPPVMPTPVSQPLRIHQSSIGVHEFLPPQPPFPQPPSYFRPTSNNNYPCTDPSEMRRPRAMAHEIYRVRSSTIQASQLSRWYTASPPRDSRPPSSNS